MHLSATPPPGRRGRSGRRRHRVAAAGAACALVLGGALTAAVPAHAGPVTPVAAVPAAITTAVHQAYVVKLIDTSPQGRTFPETDAQLLAHVDGALDYWVDQSDQAISSFTRTAGLPTINGDCSASNVHSSAWTAGHALFPGVTFGGATGNHLIVLAPSGCGPTGIASIGSLANGLNSGGDVFVSDSPSIIDTSLVHELGHNFSFDHANAVRCTASGGTTTCAEEGGRDFYSVMAASVIGLAGRPPFLSTALGSFERARLGVTKTCEVPALSLGSGQHDVTATYDLWGRGTKDGTRGLKIVDPTTSDTYFLDWRNKSGRDAGAYYAESLVAASGFVPGVTVDKVKALSGGNSQSVLQAITQATSPRNLSLQAAETYTAGGLSVRVDATGAVTGTAQVTVTLTNPSGTNTTLPAQQGTAAVTGTPTAGATLTAVPTNWTAGSCYRYQWLDNGTAITAARAATFTVPANPAGHVYTVRITGQQSGYQPRTVTSP
ncbi:hypothetical protein OG245_37795 (plasmid) [Streptomyces sp. NBC_01116]|uniref:hypothetical protein n=1 Tax=Streptomyces sp. NBC_01116 TaxID=2903752 RepID=UPI00324D8A68